MHLRRLRPLAQDPPRVRHHGLDARGVGPGRLGADGPRGEDARVVRPHRRRGREPGLPASTASPRRRRTPTTTRPAHTEDAHTPDAARLRPRLPAPPGAAHGPLVPRRLRRHGRAARTGYFVASRPRRRRRCVTLDLNDPDKSQVAALDFNWDVARPTSVTARGASFTDTEPGTGETRATDGLPALDARDLRAFAGRDRTVLLTAAADDPELPGRARAVLREAGWFARCEGTTDTRRCQARAARRRNRRDRGRRHAALRQVPRVGACRHTITTDSHDDGVHARPQRAWGRPRETAAERDCMNEELLIDLPTGSATASTASTAASSPTSTPTPLRIKAKVPAVLGETTVGLGDAVRALRGRPSVGFFLLPEVGARRLDRVRGRRRLYPIWTAATGATASCPRTRAPTVRGDRDQGGAQAAARRRRRGGHRHRQQRATA